MAILLNHVKCLTGCFTEHCQYTGPYKDNSDDISTTKFKPYSGKKLILKYSLSCLLFWEVK